ncbi:kinase-like domain-containing protein, partial [Blyttiomyces helicus]
HTLVGTPQYLAPEIITGEEAGQTGAQDIWSLGCVLVEMLTGRKPWGVMDNDWAVMYHIGTGEGHPALPTADLLSPVGHDFLKRCFIRRAPDRPTASQLLQHPWVCDVEVS